ncbi:hypothetical protein [Numidum massiliense]|uniref:hypothetical protein n=1 Tax=Numidum massiliense TaxID=1522315 RepID=UPI0012FC78F4|nr:hypothetical protein [Numidum massiliense]
MWGYRGSEGNDYRAENPELTWKTVGDAMYRITERERETERQRRKERVTNNG